MKFYAQQIVYLRSSPVGEAFHSLEVNKGVTRWSFLSTGSGSTAGFHWKTVLCVHCKLTTVVLVY